MVGLIFKKKKEKKSGDGLRKLNKFNWGIGEEEDWLSLGFGKGVPKLLEGCAHGGVGQTRANACGI